MTTSLRKMDVTISVPIPFSTRWIDEFLGLKCAREILELYPNAKEITESMAVFGAIRKVRDVYPSILADADVSCVVPGDGVSPRTAALAAYRTRWNVFSIDPLARSNFTANRLVVYKKKMEEMPDEIFGAKRSVVLSCHSHVALDVVLQKIFSPEIIVIALQCCVDMNIKGETPIREYRDHAIFSPENLIKIWHIKKGTKNEDGNTAM